MVNSIQIFQYVLEVTIGFIILITLRNVLLLLIYKFKIIRDEKTYKIFYPLVNKTISIVIIWILLADFFNRIFVHKDLLNITNKSFLSLLIIYFGYKLNQIITLNLQPFFEKVKKYYFEEFIRKTICTVILTIVILIIFSLFEIPIIPIISFIIVILLIVGISMKDQISNIVSGISLILSSHIKEGYYIKVGDYEGEVLEIGLGYIKLKDYRKKTIIIPSHSLLLSPIEIISTNGKRIHEVEMVIPIYEKSLDKIIEKIENVINKTNNVDKNNSKVYIDKVRDNKVFIKAILIPSTSKDKNIIKNFIIELNKELENVKNERS